MNGNSLGDATTQAGAAAAPTLTPAPVIEQGKLETVSFNTEPYCREAAEVGASAEAVAVARPNHPWLSPPALQAKLRVLGEELEPYESSFIGVTFENEPKLRRLAPVARTALNGCLRPEELAKGPSMKTVMVVTFVGLSLVGCGDDEPGDKPYCCAVQKVAGDFRYQEEYRADLSRVAGAENEDACKTIVEANFDRFEEAFYDCF